LGNHLAISGVVGELEIGGVTDIPNVHVSDIPQHGEVYFVVCSDGLPDENFSLACAKTELDGSSHYFPRSEFSQSLKDRYVLQ